MAFVQIIECKTNQIDKLLELETEWRQATEGKRTLKRSIVAQDRNDPSRYLILAFFDSFEQAMENSKLPETSAFADKQGAILGSPMSFQDLDIIEDVQ